MPRGRRVSDHNMRAFDLNAPMDWQEDAACAGELGPDGSAQDEWFFPGRRDVQDGTWFLSIARFCAGCPVRLQCEQFGQAHDSPGVWGGILFNNAGEVDLSFQYWREHGRLRENRPSRKSKVGPIAEVA
jgi:Transcription factor WhiB